MEGVGYVVRGMRNGPRYIVILRFNDKADGDGNVGKPLEVSS